MQWENDPLYRLIRTIKNVMDRYYLDPLIGLFFPTAGDIFSSAMTLPFLTVSLFKIKSIPLTLAILYNMLVDMMLGIIPLDWRPAGYFQPFVREKLPVDCGVRGR